MATQTQTSKGGAGFMVLLLLTAAVMVALYSAKKDPDNDSDDGDRWGVVEMVIIWMDRVLDRDREWDPEWENEPTKLVDPARDLTITYWVNEQRHAALYDDDQKGEWTETVSYPAGTEIELLAEELAGPGGGRTPFKMCMVQQIGTRNIDYMHRNDMGDCSVSITVR